MDIDKFSNLVKSNYLRETKVYADFELHETISELIIPKKEFDDLIEQLDEPEKVVVPAFVGDWIDVAKSRHHTLLQAVDEYAPTDIKEWVWKYFNSDLFGKAWLAYPNVEVEEEQKYILSINITDKASKTNYETFLNKRGIFHSMKNESFNTEEFNWSEEEIKDLENGEILFEHFAVPVEEVEE